MAHESERTSVSPSGTKPVIVFIHGSGDSARSWSSVIEQLPQYICVALDLPGHGAAHDRTGPDVMSVSDYAGAVQTLLTERSDRDSPTGICLVGHSLGSAIAMRLAADHPALITHLVLIGAGARLRVLPALLEEARIQPDEAMRKLITLGLAPEHEAHAPHYFDALQSTALGALHRDLSACNDFDMMGELDHITQPTLIIVGDADRLTPPKYAAFLHDHIPGAELRTVANAGHYVQTEAPDTLAAVLRDWLSRHA